MEYKFDVCQDVEPRTWIYLIHEIEVYIDGRFYTERTKGPVYDYCYTDFGYGASIDLGKNPPPGMIDVIIKIYYEDINGTRLLCETTVPTAYEIPAPETTTTTTTSTTTVPRTTPEPTTVKIETTTYKPENEYSDLYSSTQISNNYNNYGENRPSYSPSSPDESIWDDPGTIRLAVKIILLIIFIALVIVAKSMTK